MYVISIKCSDFIFFIFRVVYTYVFNWLVTRSSLYFDDFMRLFVLNYTVDELEKNFVLPKRFNFITSYQFFPIEIFLEMQ